MTNKRPAPESRESLLRDLFAEVLNVADVSADDRFFDLGGDSISAVELVSRARESGMEFTRRELFLHQSAAELATVVREPAPAPAAESDQAGAGDRAVPTGDTGTPGRIGHVDPPLVSLSQAELDDIARQFR